MLKHHTAWTISACWCFISFHSAATMASCCSPSEERQSGNAADGPHVADWTQLPEGCRLLVVQRMDSDTRAAWRATCRLTCQDVRAATRTLTWHGRDKKHLSNVPLPHRLPLISPLDCHPTSLPAALMSSLPSFHHLNCCGMAELSSIQGIPPTLRSLDLSGCNQLQHILPLQHCTALEQLALVVGPSSDCTPLPSCMSVISSGLQRLSPNATPQRFAAPETAEAIVRSLEPLTGLQELSLRLRITDSKLCQTLATNVARMTDLRVLHLSDSNLGQGLGLVAPAIRQLRCLKYLDLSHNSPDAAATAALAQAISSLPPTLTRLELGHMYISDADAATLIPCLQAHSATLRTIGMWESIRGPLGIAAAAAALHVCSALTSLELCQWTHTGGAAALATALSGSAPCLTALTVTHSGLEHMGAAALASLLSSMSSLATLNFSKNGLGPAGAVVLSALPPSLTSVTLSSNPFGNDGAAALAPTLARLTALTTLDLSFCELGRAGVATLVPVLPSSLTSLSLCGNDLGDDGAATLAAALRCRSNLTHLKCMFTETGPAGAAALASALPSLPRLKCLYLGCTPLGFEGLRALAQGLQALSKPQAWTIVFCCRLMKDGALCDPQDTQALASILDGITHLRSWELCPALPYPAREKAMIASRVFGLKVEVL